MMPMMIDRIKVHLDSSGAPRLVTCHNKDGDEICQLPVTTVTMDFKAHMQGVASLGFHASRVKVISDSDRV